MERNRTHCAICGKRITEQEPATTMLRGKQYHGTCMNGAHNFMADLAEANPTEPKPHYVSRPLYWTAMDPQHRRSVWYNAPMPR